ARRALLKTERPRERRERRWHAVDNGIFAARLARLADLLVLPVPQDLVRVGHRPVSEDMRMALHHLRRRCLGDLGCVEPAFLSRDLGVHRNLQQEVAELLPHLGVVAAVDRLEQLISLLEEVLAQRFVRLLAVPWAAVRGAKRVHDLEDRTDPVLEWLAAVTHGRDITAAPCPAS